MDGGPVQRSAFVATFPEVARADGVSHSVSSWDGARLWTLASTHRRSSPEPHGDLWAIQLLGRWGSRSVELYVKEAAVGIAASRARSAATAISLQRLASGFVNDPRISQCAPAQQLPDIVRQEILDLAGPSEGGGHSTVLEALADIFVRQEHL